VSPSLALTWTLDDDALGRALDDAAPAHLALAVRMLGDGDDARDAVQEAWFRAWRHRGAVREPGAVHGWLRAIVARECLRALRRRALRRWLPFTVLPEAVDPRPRPDRLLADGEARRNLLRAVEALPPRQRLVWGLRFDEGWTLAEIAAATETRPDTVKTHLERALATVQRRLGGSVRPEGE